MCRNCENITSQDDNFIEYKSFSDPSHSYFWCEVKEEDYCLAIANEMSQKKYCPMCRRNLEKEK